MSAVHLQLQYILLVRDKCMSYILPIHIAHPQLNTSKYADIEAASDVTKRNQYL